MTNPDQTKKPRPSPKRRRLEPLSLEEALAAPGMSGFVSFLSPPPPVPHLMALGQAETPTGEVSTPEVEKAPPTVATPGVDSTPGIDLTAGGVDAAARRHPREKVFRATLAQHGHSSGEQCLLQAMWNAAEPEQGTVSRRLHMGYRGLAAISNLNPKSVKANLKSLEHKLAIETIGEFSSTESSGRTYRIFSNAEILARREKAGMLWVRKIKGVEFINLAELTPGAVSTSGVAKPISPAVLNVLRRAKIVIESEMQAFRAQQERLLEDPAVSEQEKLFARRLLELAGAGS